MTSGRGAAVIQVVDRVVTVLGSVLLVGVALLSPAAAGISGMRTEDCHGPCNDALVAGSGLLLVGGLVVTAVGTLAAVGLLRDRLRFLWWLPCGGLVVAVLIVVIANATMSAAIGA